jgi:hypothetical protein
LQNEEVTAGSDLGKEVLAEEARLDELERRRDESRLRSPFAACAIKITSGRER